MKSFTVTVVANIGLIFKKLQIAFSRAVINNRIVEN